MYKFEIKKNTTAVYVIDVKTGYIWWSMYWNLEDFTERKLSNAIKRTTKGLGGNCKFIRTF